MKEDRGKQELLAKLSIVQTRFEMERHSYQYELGIVFLMKKDLVLTGKLPLGFKILLDTYFRFTNVD